MNNDAGWSGSGGPWITPEQSMQKVVWTRNERCRGRRISTAMLPQPEDGGGLLSRHRGAGLPDAGRAIASRHPGQGGVYPPGSARPQQARRAVPAGETIARARQFVEPDARRLAADGRLAWDVPAGKWTIAALRPHADRARTIIRRRKTGRGLECDKLSRKASRRNVRGLDGQADRGHRAAGGQRRWSRRTSTVGKSARRTGRRGFREEFQRRRGYDLLPFLPVMTGRVVDSLEVSERFLWDLRQTVSELVLENYAGPFPRAGPPARAAALDRGLRRLPCDDMTYAGRADEPMGEFWSRLRQRRRSRAPRHGLGRARLRANRSSAPKRSRPATQEKWREHPGDIKTLGDWAFCEGINRFVFHRYAMQPWPDAPAGHDDGTVGTALRAHADLVGAVDAPGTSTWPAASTCCGRGCSWPTSATSRRKAPGSVPAASHGPGEPARSAGLQLRRLHRRGAAHAHVGEGRPAGAARRHELPRAGAAGGRDDDARTLLRKIKELVEAGATVVGPPRR